MEDIMKNLLNQIKATYKTVDDYLEKNESNIYFTLTIIFSLGLLIFWESDKYIIIRMPNIITILFCLLIVLNIIMYVLCFKGKFLNIKIALLDIELKELEERMKRNELKLLENTMKLNLKYLKKEK